VRADRRARTAPARGDHHEPWPLQPADAEIELTTISPIALDGPPLVHFARRQDVVIWPLEPVR
jgi:hypothetical protein